MATRRFIASNIEIYFLTPSGIANCDAAFFVPVCEEGGGGEVYVCGRVMRSVRCEDEGREEGNVRGRNVSERKAVHRKKGRVRETAERECVNPSTQTRDKHRSNRQKNKEKAHRPPLFFGARAHTISYN